MPRFEVELPPEVEGGAAMRVRLEADDWIAAWRRTLVELGDGVDPRDLTCDIQPESIEVRHLVTGRRLIIRPDSREPLPPPTAEVALARETLRVPVVGRPQLGGRVQQSRSGARRRLRTSGHRAYHVVGSPFVASLTGDGATRADEAIATAFRHIPCGAAQLLVREAVRGALRVSAAQGELAQAITGSRLLLGRSLVGATEHGPARVKLAGEGHRLRYQIGLLRRLDYAVSSLLWVPVPRAGQTREVILLLNSAHRRGFSDADMQAVCELARVISAQA